MERKKDAVYSRFLQVSEEMGLPVKKILDVFYVLNGEDSIENNELLRKVGVSRNVLNKVKKSLSDLLKPQSKRTELSSSGRQLIRTLYEKGFLNEEELWNFILDDKYTHTLGLLKNLASLRPKPERQYDQFTATVETTARRASLMNFFGDIKGKRLLFLGDDDFTSVAVSSYHTAQEILVADIDERILSVIDDVSNYQQLGIKTLKYDARKKVSGNVSGKFDIVFTDPPYTTKGIELFVSRAIDFLDPNNKSSRIYLCYGNSDAAKERFLPIQKIFVDSGLMTRWIFDKFNRYTGAESIGSTSSLFVLDSTAKTKATIVGDCKTPIYTNN